MKESINTDINKDTDIVEMTEDREVLDHIEKLRIEREAIIKKEAERRVKKHHREIKRLRKHAEACLLANNKQGYIYSVAKLRTITGNTVSDDILETLWTTSREEVLRIINSYSSALSGK